MRHSLEIIAVCLSFLQCGANSDAVVKIAFEGRQCSGVCVSPDGIILTAEHCQLGNGSRVEFPRDGMHSASLAYRPHINGIDEATVLRVRALRPLPFYQIAEGPPRVGQSIYSLGYPAGNYARLEGRLLHIDAFVSQTDFRLRSGHSGGPLLNASGEVIGLASSRSMTASEAAAMGMVIDGKAYSLFVSWDSIQTAMQSPERQTLVCFSRPGCAPCEQFKADVRAGLYRDYNVIISEHSPGTDTWSNPDVMREFTRATNPQGRLAYPTFWIRGGDTFTSGYSSRGGLLQWISSVVRVIIGGLLGSQPDDFNAPSTLPPPPPSEQPDNNGRQSQSLQAHIDTLNVDIAKMRGLLASIVTDVKEFRDAGVIGKLKNLKEIKAEVEAAKVLALKAKGDAISAVDDAKSDPLQFLWGLLGLFPGLARSHFRNKDHA